MPRATNHVRPGTPGLEGQGEFGQEIPLGQLAMFMRRSSWQRDELATIKDKFGFKIYRSLIGLMETICCGNLYSYVGEQSHWLMIREEAQWELLDEMNERVFGRKRKFTPKILISRLVLVFCLGCISGLGMSTYHQYRRDYYTFHLVRYNASLLVAEQNQMGPLKSDQLIDGLNYAQALMV